MNRKSLQFQGCILIARQKRRGFYALVSICSGCVFFFLQPLFICSAIQRNYAIHSRNGGILQKEIILVKRWSSSRQKFMLILPPFYFAPNCLNVFLPLYIKFKNNHFYFLSFSTSPCSQTVCKMGRIYLKESVYSERGCPSFICWTGTARRWLFQMSWFNH